MAYVVDRVVICDAFREPDKHYQLLYALRLATGAGKTVVMALFVTWSTLLLARAPEGLAALGVKGFEHEEPEDVEAEGENEGGR